MIKKQSTVKRRAKRSFTDEFKKDAVNLVVVEGCSFARAADGVDVSPKSLREWYDKFAPEPEACGEDATVQQLRDENQRLRKELKRAEMEREILKKATAYFARESQ